MIVDIQPAADATVLRYGLRRLLWALPALFVVPSGPFLFYVVLTSRPSGSGWQWLPVGLFLLASFVCGRILVSRWRKRRAVTAFDAVGFWWIEGKQATLIRWDSLAGVGIYWARPGKTVVHTVELCPKGEIDRDDPLLWSYVRDAAPLHPDLPRLRYRIDVENFPGAYGKALRQWAPELWFGRQEQPDSYLGAPDRVGHRERTAAAQEAALQPPEIGDTVVVHEGRPLARRGFLVLPILTILGALAVWGLVPGHGHGVVAVVRYVIAAVIVLYVGWLDAIGVRSMRTKWNQRITMDATGVHWTQKGRGATVPWSQLAAVGIHHSAHDHTLELCPKGEVDRDAPVLWQFVRDAEPQQPGLPRLRYRISVSPVSGRYAVAAGCRRWAPELWFTGERMANNYVGSPDRKGHRQRLRAAQAG
ncbi:hypothetical protein ACFVXE_28320 [Streptomyces sp. NPDC058231]|uniref:hypothetical protein n=1 Tax=Streptomyces sp. NPDC058231 TaxID=3346392 RepID=UPI0036E2E91B